MKPVKPESPDEVFLQFVYGSEGTTLNDIHQLFLHHSWNGSVVAVVVLGGGGDKEEGQRQIKDRKVAKNVYSLSTLNDQVYSEEGNESIFV